ncbi:MAG: bifunctional 5,10-methylenetetrahydrofolate dehydrogenase/5,10-methenyltetrahydrofolate cyclohydrolase [Bacteroidales bacterium]|nr:bifunctional 5,10-methylenetetrahydrofolate dehydrogenase/5,10-methenyltetrahydrofolate cyclohydrolase [Bacteroidales bacterium]
MKILDGKALSIEKMQALTERVNAFSKKTGRQPKLTILLTGKEHSSVYYVGLKQKKCTEVGIECEIIHLEENISQEAIEQQILTLNNDKKVDGILVQLPLPSHLDSHKIIELIDVQKDVDGLTSKSMGHFAAGKPQLLPCTAKGIIALLKANHIEMDGKRAVVIGRSNLVGRPTVQMLLRENCTVTQAHSHSSNLPEIVSQAEILVLAMGAPNVITPTMLRDLVVIVDVAINRVNDQIEGDLYNAKNLPLLTQKAAAITPVPGGVGPMTVISLLENVMEAAEMRH